MMNDMPKITHEKNIQGNGTYVGLPGMLFLSNMGYIKSLTYSIVQFSIEVATAGRVFMKVVCHLNYGIYPLKAHGKGVSKKRMQKVHYKQVIGR